MTSKETVRYLSKYCLLKALDQGSFKPGGMHIHERVGMIICKHYKEAAVTLGGPKLKANRCLSVCLHSSVLLDVL